MNILSIKVTKNYGIKEGALIENQTSFGWDTNCFDIPHDNDIASP